MKHFCCLAAILCVATSISMAASPIKIYAHRGASAYAPENTTPSMALGFKMGADAVELDTWMSKDGRVMVIHDGDTSRTGGKKYVINDTDSSVLRELDVSFNKGPQYAGTKIPFLEEYMEQLPKDKGMILEFKDTPASVPPIKKILEESGKIDNVVLISFKLDTLTAAHKAMPQLKSYYLASAKKGSSPKAIDPNTINEAKAAGFTGVNYDYRYVTPELRQAAKDAGLEFLVWTVDEPADIERMVKMDIGAITTNKPDTTRATVEKLTK